MDWLGAFLFTQVVEVPVYLAAMQRQRSAASWWRRTLFAFGASALTHPFVWFVFPLTMPMIGYWGYVALAETFAVAAEAFWLSRCGVKNAPGWSLAANVASAGIGFASRAVFGWP